MLLPAIRFSYGFAIAALLSKQLSVADYGQWSLFVSTVLLVLTFSSLNLMYASSILLAGRTLQQQKQDMFSVSVFKFLVTIGVFCGIAVYLIATETFQLNLLAIMGLALIAVTLNNTVFGFLRALLCLKRQVVFFLFENAAIVLAVAVATRVMSGGLEAALWGYLVAEVVAVVFGLVLMRRYLGWFPFDWSTVKRYLKIGVPLLPFAFSDLIVASLVPLLIKLYDSFESVGLYSIAQKVALAATIPNAIINNVYAQYLKQSWLEQGLAAVKRRFMLFVAIYLGLVVPVLIGLVLFGKQLILLVSTTEYLVSYDLMFMLALVNLLIMLTAMLTTLFAVFERTRTIGFIWLGVLALYLILNQLLVPTYKLDGIAYALLVSFGVGLVAVAIAAWRLLNSVPNRPSADQT